MGRLIIIAAVAVLGWILFQWLRKEYSKKGRPFAIKALLIGAAIALVALAASGRVHWIGAAAASLLAIARFALPLVLRNLSIFERFLHSRSNQQQSQTGSGNNNKMTEKEALAILGLEPGASREEIISAHRKLIQKLHPDRGGSEFLASQLNEAKDRLIS